ncbi:MAG TPA: apolipoprotein N-acyltransferase, partial [Burkholderiaceae bacterium]
MTTRAAAPAVPAGPPLALESGLALAVGALHSLTFVHTAAWPLQIALVAWLAWRAGAATPARAAALG